MAWNNVTPNLSASKAPVKLGVMQMVGACPKITITLNADMMGQIGSPSKCNVYLGDGGDDDGCLLLQFDNDGNHVLNKLARGGAKLLVPLISGAPKEKSVPREVAFERCETDEGVHQITIRLPW